MNEAPTLYRTTAKPEWIDEYGHMNMAYYPFVCDQATYAFWEQINAPLGLDERGGAEYAVVESHVNYLREVRRDDPLRVTTQLLGADHKRFRLFHTLFQAGEGYVAATNEIMALGFDLEGRRLMAFNDAVRARLVAWLAEHATLPTPQNAGRGIAMPAPRA